MHESTNKAEDKIIYRELCYVLNGLFFKIHNELDDFAERNSIVMP